MIEALFLASFSTGEKIFLKHVLIQIKDLIFLLRATNGDQLAEDILDRCITSKGGHEVNIDIIDV